MERLTELGFDTLTMLPGTFLIVSLTVLLGMTGLAEVPHISDLTNVGWEIFLSQCCRGFIWNGGLESW